MAPLDPARERDLARTIEAGVFAEHLLDEDTGTATHRAELTAIARAGREARDEFLLANIGLVKYLVRRDAPRADHREDLVQEGCLALVEALATFDWRRGMKFSTWAVPRVRGRIAAARRSERGGIRLPAGVARAEAASGETALSVTGLAGVGPAVGLAGTADPDDEPEAAGPEPAAVRRALDDLAPEERRVVVMRFGLDGEPGDTQRGVAERLGVSIKWVRRREYRGLDRLRETLPDLCRAETRR